MVDENYSIIFQGFTELSDNFGNFMNNILVPQSAGIGQLLAIVGMIVLFIAVIIIAWRRSQKMF